MRFENTGIQMQKKTPHDRAADVASVATGVVTDVFAEICNPRTRRVGITYVRRVRALMTWDSELTVVVECVQLLQDGTRIRVLTHCGSQQLAVAARVKKCGSVVSLRKKKQNRVKKKAKKT